MSALVVALIAVNLILLAERYVFWRLLWAKYHEREARADQMLDLLLKMYDRMLALKGVRPILTELKASETRERPPAFSQDELDAIKDRIKERLEIANFRNEPITPAQAEAEVWASLGHAQPPNPF